MWATASSSTDALLWPWGASRKVQTLSVMGDYFHVMQIPLRVGRDFTPLDREEQPLVAVVNEEMVREFLPHENPIGVRIRWAGDTRAATMDDRHRRGGRRKTFRIESTDGSRCVCPFFAERRSLETIYDARHPGSECVSWAR